MSRPAKFSHQQIVEATARIAARDGPAKATIASIAQELQAPSGSIYHRFASRDLLLGEVWLRAAEDFQAGVGALLDAAEPWAAGLAAALYVPARVRAAPAEASILLLHRREDFMAGGWPEPLARRARQLRTRADQGLRDFARRLLGRTDADAIGALSYALAGAPLAAVLPFLRAGKSPPRMVDTLVRATYAAVLLQLGAAEPDPPPENIER